MLKQGFTQIHEFSWEFGTLEWKFGMYSELKWHLDNFPFDLLPNVIACAHESCVFRS